MQNKSDQGGLDQATENTKGVSLEPVSSCGETIPNSGRPHRKLQVGNGFLLEFEQLSRILNYLLTQHTAKKISRKELHKETGLSDRHLESLVSMCSAMGLVRPRLQVLTPTGYLVAAHDMFFEKKGTLEWCHYVGAGTYKNLIWFEAFNRLLQVKTLLTQEEWYRWFRNALSGNYSKGTVTRSIAQEIRFVIDAYMNQDFANLGVLGKLPDGRIYSQRYTDFSGPVFAAMLYDFFDKNKTRLYQVKELVNTPGSPAMVFKMDEMSFRQQVEIIHECGWLRYETTHGLDQIRLKPGFCAREFIAVFYEEREPCPDQS